MAGRPLRRARREREARGNAKKPEKALYTAIFLDDPDSLKRWWVETTGIPLLPKHYAHHMTIKFKPDAEEVVNLPIGKPVLLRIVGWAADAKGQAVEVESSVGSTNRIAHITVATDGTSPVYSNTLLAEGVTPANGVLEGSVGYQSTKGREVFDLTGTIYDKKARENPTEAECDERVRKALSRRKKKAQASTWESPEDFPAMPSFARPSSRFIVGGSQVTTMAIGNAAPNPGPYYHSGGWHQHPPSDKQILAGFAGPVVKRRFIEDRIAEIDRMIDEAAMYTPEVKAWVKERADLEKRLSRIDTAGPEFYRWVSKKKEEERERSHKKWLARKKSKGNPRRNPSLKPGSTIRHFRGSSVIWRVVDLSFADTESYGEPVWIIEQIAGKTKRKSPRTLKQSTADLYYVDAESAPVKTIYKKNPRSRKNARLVEQDPKWVKEADWREITSQDGWVETDQHYKGHRLRVKKFWRRGEGSGWDLYVDGEKRGEVVGDYKKWWDAAVEVEKLVDAQAAANPRRRKNPKSSKKEFVEQAWAKRAHRLPAHDYEPRKGLEGPFQYPSGKVLYWDPREGKYWDPSSDLYLTDEEIYAHIAPRKNPKSRGKKGPVTYEELQAMAKRELRGPPRGPADEEDAVMALILAVLEAEGTDLAGIDRDAALKIMKEEKRKQVRLWHSARDLGSDRRPATRRFWREKPKVPGWRQAGPISPDWALYTKGNLEAVIERRPPYPHLGKGFYNVVIEYPPAGTQNYIHQRADTLTQAVALFAQAAVPEPGNLGIEGLSGDGHSALLRSIRKKKQEEREHLRESRRRARMRKNPKSRSKSERAKERRLRRLLKETSRGRAHDQEAMSPKEKGRLSEHGWPRSGGKTLKGREKRRKLRQIGKAIITEEAPERVSPAKSGKPQKGDRVIIFENLPGGKRKRWTYRGEKMSGDVIEVTTQGGGAGRKHGFLVYWIMFETYPPGEESPELWSATFTEPDFSVEKVAPPGVPSTRQQEAREDAKLAMDISHAQDLSLEEAWSMVKDTREFRRWPRKNPKSRRKPRQPSARQQEAQEEAKLAMKISHELGIPLKEAWDIVRSEGAYALLSRGY